jgi:hypothetical protein
MPRTPKAAAAATPPALQIPVLDDAAGDAFARYQREKEKARKAWQADAKAKEAKESVIVAMGDHMLAWLPDGRLVQRIPKSRKMPAKAAHTQAWEDLIESDLGPAAAVAEAA